MLLSRKIRNVIALTVCISFITPFISWAFEQTPFIPTGNTISFKNQFIEIPKKYGTVTTFHQGGNKTIVHIQDLHCHYKVQTNISKVIANLSKQHQLDLIGIEGAFKPVNVTKLSTFPVANIKNQVGRYYMKQGKLSGAEFYAVTAKKPIKLEGIEDREHYLKEKKLVKSFLNDETQGYIYDLLEAFELAKDEIYNQGLKIHDKQFSDFRKGQLSLTKFAHYLYKACLNDHIDMDDFKNMQVLLTHKNKVLPESMDYDQLIIEIELAERLVRERYYINELERLLDQHVTRAHIMEKLLNISVTPEELQTFRANPAAFDIKNYIAFLNTHTSYNDHELDAELFILDQHLDNVRAFYQVADQRSYDFADNIDRLMNEHKTDLSVIITGGYHTKEVLHALKTKGYSYLSVKPEHTEQDVLNPYFNLLREKKNPLELLLARNQEKYALAPFFAQVENTKMIANEQNLPKATRIGYEIMQMMLMMLWIKQLVQEGQLTTVVQDSAHDYFKSNYPAYNPEALALALEDIKVVQQSVVIPLMDQEFFAVFYPQEYSDTLTSIPAIYGMDVQQLRISFFNNKHKPAVIKRLNQQAKRSGQDIFNISSIVGALFPGMTNLSNAVQTNRQFGVDKFLFNMVDTVKQRVRSWPTTVKWPTFQQSRQLVNELVNRIAPTGFVFAIEERNRKAVFDHDTGKIKWSQMVWAVFKENRFLWPVFASYFLLMTVFDMAQIQHMLEMTGAEQVANSSAEMLLDVLPNLLIATLSLCTLIVNRNKIIQSHGQSTMIYNPLTKKFINLSMNEKEQEIMNHLVLKLFVTIGMAAAIGLFIGGAAFLGSTYGLFLSMSIGTFIALSLSSAIHLLWQFIAKHFPAQRVIYKAIAEENSNLLAERLLEATNENAPIDWRAIQEIDNPDFRTEVLELLKQKNPAFAIRYFAHFKQTPEAVSEQVRSAYQRMAAVHQSLPAIQSIADHYATLDGNQAMLSRLQEQVTLFRKHWQELETIRNATGKYDLDESLRQWIGLEHYKPELASQISENAELMTYWRQTGQYTLLEEMNRIGKLVNETMQQLAGTIDQMPMADKQQRNVISMNSFNLYLLHPGLFYADADQALSDVVDIRRLYSIEQQATMGSNRDAVATPEFLKEPQLVTGAVGQDYAATIGSVKQALAKWPEKRLLQIVFKQNKLQLRLPELTAQESINLEGTLTKLGLKHTQSKLHYKDGKGMSITLTAPESQFQDHHERFQHELVQNIAQAWDVANTSDEIKHSQALLKSGKWTEKEIGEWLAANQLEQGGWRAVVQDMNLESRMMFANEVMKVHPEIVLDHYNEFGFSFIDLNKRSGEALHDLNNAMTGLTAGMEMLGLENALPDEIKEALRDNKAEVFNFNTAVTNIIIQIAKFNKSYNSELYQPEEHVAETKSILDAFFRGFPGLEDIEGKIDTYAALLRSKKDEDQIKRQQLIQSILFKSYYFSYRNLPRINQQVSKIVWQLYKHHKDVGQVMYFLSMIYKGLQNLSTFYSKMQVFNIPDNGIRINMNYLYAMVHSIKNSKWSTINLMNNWQDNPPEEWEKNTSSGNALGSVSLEIDPEVERSTRFLTGDYFLLTDTVISTLVKNSIEQTRVDYVKKHLMHQAGQAFNVVERIVAGNVDLTENVRNLVLGTIGQSKKYYAEGYHQVYQKFDVETKSFEEIEAAITKLHNSLLDVTAETQEDFYEALNQELTAMQKKQRGTVTADDPYALTMLEVNKLRQEKNEYRHTYEFYSAVKNAVNEANLAHIRGRMADGVERLGEPVQQMKEAVEKALQAEGYHQLVLPVTNLFDHAKDEVKENEPFEYESNIRIAFKKDRIIIEDMAGGMPESLLNKLQRGVTSKKAGTGIGLASAKRLMQLMDGTLKIENYTTRLDDNTSKQGLRVTLFFEQATTGQLLKKKRDLMLEMVLEEFWQKDLPAGFTRRYLPGGPIAQILLPLSNFFKSGRRTAARLLEMAEAGQPIAWDEIQTLGVDQRKKIIRHLMKQNPLFALQHVGKINPEFTEDQAKLEQACRVFPEMDMERVIERVLDKEQSEDEALLLDMLDEFSSLKLIIKRSNDLINGSESQAVTVAEDVKNVWEISDDVMTSSAMVSHANENAAMASTWKTIGSVAYLQSYLGQLEAVTNGFGNILRENRFKHEPELEQAMRTFVVHSELLRNHFDESVKSQNELEASTMDLRMVYVLINKTIEQLGGKAKLKIDPKLLAQPKSVEGNVAVDYHQIIRPVLQVMAEAQLMDKVVILIKENKVSIALPGLNSDQENQLLDISKGIKRFHPAAFLPSPFQHDRGRTMMVTIPYGVKPQNQPLSVASHQEWLQREIAMQEPEVAVDTRNRFGQGWTLLPVAGIMKRFQDKNIKKLQSDSKIERFWTMAKILLMETTVLVPFSIMSAWLTNYLPFDQITTLSTTSGALVALVGFGLYYTGKLFSFYFVSLHQHHVVVFEDGQYVQKPIEDQHRKSLVQLGSVKALLAIGSIVVASIVSGGTVVGILAGLSLGLVLAFSFHMLWNLKIIKMKPGLMAAGIMALGKRATLPVKAVDSAEKKQKTEMDFYQSFIQLSKNALQSKVAWRKLGNRLKNMDMDQREWIIRFCIVQHAPAAWVLFKQNEKKFSNSAKQTIETSFSHYIKNHPNVLLRLFHSHPLYYNHNKSFFDEYLVTSLTYASDEQRLTFITKLSASNKLKIGSLLNYSINTMNQQVESQKFPGFTQSSLGALRYVKKMLLANTDPNAAFAAGGDVSFVSIKDVLIYGGIILSLVLPYILNTSALIVNTTDVFSTVLKYGLGLLFILRIFYVAALSMGVTEKLNEENVQKHGLWLMEDLRSTHHIDEGIDPVFYVLPKSTIGQFIHRGLTMVQRKGDNGIALHPHFLALPEVAQRALLINALSKSQGSGRTISFINELASFIGLAPQQLTGSDRVITKQGQLIVKTALKKIFAENLWLIPLVFITGCSQFIVGQLPFDHLSYLQPWIQSLIQPITALGFSAFFTRQHGKQVLVYDPGKDQYVKTDRSWVHTVQLLVLGMGLATTVLAGLAIGSAGIVGLGTLASLTVGIGGGLLAAFLLHGLWNFLLVKNMALMWRWLYWFGFPEWQAKYSLAAGQQNTPDRVTDEWTTMSGILAANKAVTSKMKFRQPLGSGGAIRYSPLLPGLLFIGALLSMMLSPSGEMTLVVKSMGLLSGIGLILYLPRLLAGWLLSRQPDLVLTDGNIEQQLGRLRDDVIHDLQQQGRWRSDFVVPQLAVLDSPEKELGKASFYSGFKIGYGENGVVRLHPHFLSINRVWLPSFMRTILLRSIMIHEVMEANHTGHIRALTEESRLWLAPKVDIPEQGPSALTIPGIDFDDMANEPYQMKAEPGIWQGMISRLLMNANNGRGYWQTRTGLPTYSPLWSSALTTLKIIIGMNWFWSKAQPKPAIDENHPEMKRLLANQYLPDKQGSAAFARRYGQAYAPEPVSIRAITELEGSKAWNWRKRIQMILNLGSWYEEQGHDNKPTIYLPNRGLKQLLEKKPDRQKHPIQYWQWKSNQFLMGTLVYNQSFNYHDNLLIDRVRTSIRSMTIRINLRQWRSTLARMFTGTRAVTALANRKYQKTAIPQFDILRLFESYQNEYDLLTGKQETLTAAINTQMLAFNQEGQMPDIHAMLDMIEGGVLSGPVGDAWKQLLNDRHQLKTEEKQLVLIDLAAAVIDRSASTGAMMAINRPMQEASLNSEESIYLMNTPAAFRSMVNNLDEMIAALQNMQNGQHLLQRLIMLQQALMSCPLDGQAVVGQMIVLESTIAKGVLGEAIYLASNEHKTNLYLGEHADNKHQIALTTGTVVRPVIQNDIAYNSRRVFELRGEQLSDLVAAERMLSRAGMVAKPYNGTSNDIIHLPKESADIVVNRLLNAATIMPDNIKTLLHRQAGKLNPNDYLNHFQQALQGSRVKQLLLKENSALNKTYLRFALNPTKKNRIRFIKTLILVVKFQARLVKQQQAQNRPAKAQTEKLQESIVTMIQLFNRFAGLESTIAVGQWIDRPEGVRKLKVHVPGILEKTFNLATLGTLMDVLQLIDAINLDFDMFERRRRRFFNSAGRAA